MTLEPPAANELPTFLIYDTISATPHHASNLPTSLLFNNAIAGDASGLLGFFGDAGSSSAAAPAGFPALESTNVKPEQARRKRRRRPRSCKNKEEAESQRMTHIAVERNRRRQMNEHLTVLRSLMPDSYVQRGDQASIVGGAIDFVKELEQLLQSLEAQKRTLRQPRKSKSEEGMLSAETSEGSCSSKSDDNDLPPFAQFFAYPQYTWCHAPRDYPAPPESSSRTSVADIEVTLIETHANLRILAPRRPRQLIKMVAALQGLRFTILHLNVTSLDSMVLYSISAKVEEGCSLTTVDDIAAAVHHMLTIIEAEAASMSQLEDRKTFAA